MRCVPSARMASASDASCKSICGNEDAVVPVSAGEAYRDAIPGSRLEVMEGCGHRPEVENPEEFVRLVQGFLSG